MKDKNHPEPVPSASQVVVLPFLAALEGLIKDQTTSTFRLTMHRVATWESQGHFQQLCTYLGSGPKDQGTVGRMLPVTTGIIGYAFEHKKIARTKRYASNELLLADLAEDMKANRETGQPEQTPPSYLAIPFVGSENEVILVLYADCREFNFFANNQLVNKLAAMCRSLASLFDWLQESEALPTIQNFPLEKGTPIKSAPTVYRRLQELVEIPVPRFKTVNSFNYEIAVP
jgi:hypothetical protein